MAYQIANESYFGTMESSDWKAGGSVEVPKSAASIVSSYTSLAKITFTNGKISQTASYVGGVAAWTLPAFGITTDYHLVAQLNFADTSNEIGLDDGILQVFTNSVGHNRAFYISKSDIKTMAPFTTRKRPSVSLEPSSPSQASVMKITKTKPGNTLPNAMVFGPYLDERGNLDALANLSKFGTVGNSNIPRYRILSIDGKEVVLNVWMSPDEIDLTRSQECDDDVCEVDYTSWAY